MRFIVATTDGPRSYIGTPTFLEGGVLRIDQDSSERGEWAVGDGFMCRSALSSTSGTGNWLSRTACQKFSLRAKLLIYLLESC